MRERVRGKEGEVREDSVNDIHSSCIWQLSMNGILPRTIGTP